MIETDQQRRWWFATHPEFSSSHTGQRSKHSSTEDEESGKPSPESIDAYVDEKLKHETDNVIIAMLQEMKRWAGTAGQNPESYAELGLEWPGKAQDKAEEKEEHEQGWSDGYWAIHDGKAPPDLAPTDKSPYAQGVREGAMVALDEQEAWRQKWVDPILFLLGSHPSQILGKNLTEAVRPRPSPDHDAHHIVPWRHWAAQESRDILKNWGIEMDSAANGMWLERTYHWRLSNSRQYMDTVFHMLEKANSKAEAEKILREIAHLLSTKKFPL
ncbi:MAG: AHH domain-containing protein [Desulfomonile tiedjei]|nr:AHH domain-containing protein [Desulfomonile tiedjei]